MKAVPCLISAAALAAAVAALFTADLRAEPAVNAAPGASAADLVRAALLAAAANDSQRRDELLSQALRKDPDYPPARWHSGYVRLDGQWLSTDDAQRRAAADQRLAEYRKLRNAQAGSLPGQLALARWCRDRGLASEARFHWMSVLLAQPQHEEARKALGMQWRQGRLVSQSQSGKQQGQARRPEAGRHAPAARSENDSWAEHWNKQIAKWHYGALRGDLDLACSVSDALAPLAQDRSAITALTRILLTRRQRINDEKLYRAASLQLIGLLAYSSEPWAPAQLAWHAVDHPLDEARTAAGDALKKRPKEAYVPLLLWRMQSPIEASFTVVSLGLGGVFYRHTFEREVADARFVATRNVSLDVKPDRLVFLGQPEPTLPNPPPGVRVVKSAAQAFMEGRAKLAQESSKAHGQALATTAAARRSVEVANAEIVDLNRRVHYALTRATGADLAPDPLAWQKWWKDYCYAYYELEDPSEGERSDGAYDGESGTKAEKPTYEQYFYGGRAIPVSMPYPVYATATSCFPRETKVWTVLGPVPINRVKPGDRVLSQHPRTGELAYQMVLQVTRRKPSPMMKIGLGKESISATRGHPFWVCGEGWRMAKQLEVGARLHTLSGPATIDGVEQAPAAGPWYEELKHRPDAQPEDVLSCNLIVDEFHTYFVGDHKVLVHDNVLFPLDGPLTGMPGLTSP